MSARTRPIPSPRPWRPRPDSSPWETWTARAGRWARRASLVCEHNLPGWLRYHFAERKTIVLIAAPMRSGTTLLKALLAEAPDVSHLPEVDPWRYRRCLRHAIYDDIRGMCRERIVVLKRPGTPWIPLPAGFLRMKIILLVRDAGPVADSIVRMTREAVRVFPRPWTREEAFHYWCEVYEDILGDRALWQHDVAMVRYEDLVRHPVRVTEELFAFIGSSRRTGVDAYQAPRDFEWCWGSDDGGGKIRTLVVQEGAGIGHSEVSAGPESSRLREWVALVERELAFAERRAALVVRIGPRPTTTMTRLGVVHGTSLEVHRSFT